MTPHAQPCMVMFMVMVMDGLSDRRSVCLSSRTAVLGSKVGWMDGWKVIPSKTSPSRSGHECLLGSIF